MTVIRRSALGTQRLRAQGPLWALFRPSIQPQKNAIEHEHFLTKNVGVRKLTTNLRKQLPRQRNKQPQVKTIATFSASMNYNPLLLPLTALPSSTNLPPLR
jgi:hypothetical protein